MLHATETWAVTAATLWQNDRAVIRWICNVKAKDEVSSDFLAAITHCKCAWGKLRQLLPLLTNCNLLLLKLKLNVCTTSVTEGEVAGVKLV